MKDLIASLPNTKDAPTLIRTLWKTLSPLPGGKTLFSRAIGKAAPYTGTVGARVRTLEPGHAVVELADRRAVRNHLGSVHAIALMNLGEMATGLATISALPAGSRSILTGLSMDYLKKARGTLTATCHMTPPDHFDREEVEIRGEIRDREGDLVAVARARWLLGR